MKTFGERLKKLRDYYNLKALDLADKVGLSVQTISNYETGGKYPDFESLVKILESFPSLNGRWLILGNGVMITNEEDSIYKQNLLILLEDNNEYLKKAIDQLINKQN